jgi:hypothetical protein
LRVLLVAGCVLAAAVLFVLYLRQSGTEPTGSDGASLELQAWDMLHGNPLLGGWAMSDVSFWPWELSEYSLIEAVRGLSPAVVHVGGALTYTLALVLSALLAARGFRGRVAWVAGLVTAGLLVSPGVGLATRILLQEPDHFGSAIPVLLAWLVIGPPRDEPSRGQSPRDQPPRDQPSCGQPPRDQPSRGQSPRGQSPRDQPPRAASPETIMVNGSLTIKESGQRPIHHDQFWWRWGRPVLVAVVLTVGVVGDPLIIASGTAAVTLGLLVSRARGAFWPFILAAVASWPAALGVSALVRLASGFHTQSVRGGFAGWAALGHHLRLAGEGIAGLFGAGFTSGPEGGSGPLGFALVHVAGVALVAIALLIVLVRPRLWADPVLPGLAAAILALTGLFVSSGYAFDPLSVREISAVVPFGAVLAGRVFAGSAVAAWARLGSGFRAVGAAFAGLVLAGYLAALGYAAAQPQAPALHDDVAGWLAAHQMSRGLALDYWLANSVTVDSGGHATVREIEVHDGRAVRPAGWGHRDVWYSPTASYADYVLSADPPRSGIWDGVIASFGNPARVYHPDGYWVLVYRTNLLSRLTG